MTTIVTALQGEPLDALVWRATGQGSAAVDLVLNATPAIGAIGDALPEGYAVTIPDLPSNPAGVDLVQLWD